jgi:filamentous hemagglutinin
LAIAGASDVFFPNPLQTPTQSNDIAGNNPYKAPFEILTGLITGAAVTRYLLSSATIQVFRVEGSVNARVLVGEGGEVLLNDSGKMLFLNFGQKARATEFFVKRLGQGMSDVQIKSFKVPRSYLDEIRASSVPESLARRYPNQPIQVDVTKAPDQFGLRSAQIEQIQRAIIQGSGKVEP